MLRITLDTNQLVRALMRPPELATFVMAWQSRRFTIVYSRPLLDEYLLVLDYPEIAELIYPEVRRVFVTQLLALLEIIELPEIPAITLPSRTGCLLGDSTPLFFVNRASGIH